MIKIHDFKTSTTFSVRFPAFVCPFRQNIGKNYKKMGVLHLVLGNIPENVFLLISTNRDSAAPTEPFFSPWREKALLRKRGKCQ